MQGGSFDLFWRNLVGGQGLGLEDIFEESTPGVQDYVLAAHLVGLAQKESTKHQVF